MGVDVVPAVWSDPAIDWNAFDLLLMRSCWDYDRRVDEFRAWLDAREAGRTPVANPVRALRWNLDKAGFLTDLKQEGVALIPTVVAEAGDPRPLHRILEETGWDEAVVKPSVSLDANATWRARRPASADEEGALESRFREAMLSAPLLIQRYQPEIGSDGEWSMVYLGGTLSHTVRKVPARGDFRVQEQYGGRRVLVTDVPSELIAAAERTLAAARSSCGADFTYARVDGVRTDEGFLLMELEVLDPSLYLSSAPESVERARDAVRSALETPAA